MSSRFVLSHPLAGRRKLCHLQYVHFGVSLQICVRMRLAASTCFDTIAMSHRHCIILLVSLWTSPVRIVQPESRVELARGSAPTIVHGAWLSPKCVERPRQVGIASTPQNKKTEEQEEEEESSNFGML